MKMKKKLLFTILPLLILTGCTKTSQDSSSPASENTQNSAPKVYSITTATSSDYTITDLSATSASKGEKITFKVNVTNSEKLLSKVKYNSTELTADKEGVYSFTMPSRNVEISAELRDKPKAYSITAESKDGYTIEELSASSAIKGTAITFKVTVTAADKSIKAVKANDIVCLKKGELYTFDMPEENVTIHVELTAAYSVTAKNGSDYAISGLSAEKAYAGQTVSFKVDVTDTLKEIDTVKANNVSCVAVGGGIYSFTMPEEAVTIRVTTKAAALGIDLSQAKMVYMVNKLVPDQSDTFSTEGIKIMTTDGNGNAVELTEEQYKTVVYSSTDIEDLTAPIQETGVKTIDVTFNGKTRSFQIAVGAYEVKNVELVSKDLDVKLSVTCQYEGITQAQFSAFSWGMDFQHNNNKDNQGWDVVLDSETEGNRLEFSYGENNMVGFSMNITSLSNGSYTTHFGHKLVDPNGNGNMQKMDLLFPNGKAKRIVLGDKAYSVLFGNFWGKGDCDVIVADASDEYTKSAWNVDTITLTKDNEKVNVEIKGTLTSIYNDPLTEAEKKAYFDFEQYETWTTYKFDEANETNTMNATYTITKKEGIEAYDFTLTFDAYALMKDGGTENGWFMHYSDSNTNLGPEIVPADVTLDNGYKVSYSSGKDSGIAPSWANSLATFVLVAPELPQDENVKVTNLQYIRKGTDEEEKMLLRVSGKYKYTTGVPTIHVGTSQANATVTGENFTVDIEMPAIEHKVDIPLSLSYTDSDNNDKSINIKLDDLEDKHPLLGSTSTTIYGFHTDKKGNISLRANTNDTFEVGAVELENVNDKVNMTIYSAFRKGTDLTNLSFELDSTEFTKSVTETVDGNGYLKFTLDVTNAPIYEAVSEGDTKYMFKLSAAGTSYEFWPSDWAYNVDVTPVSYNGYNYSVGRVKQSWGDAQYRLEKTAIMPAE